MNIIAIITGPGSCLYEKDLATARVGSAANITSDAYPQPVFRDRVCYVDSLRAD